MSDEQEPKKPDCCNSVTGIAASIGGVTAAIVAVLALCARDQLHLAVPIVGILR